MRFSNGMEAQGRHRCCLLSEPALERKAKVGKQAVGKAPLPLHPHLPHGYEGQRHKILIELGNPRDQLQAS